MLWSCSALFSCIGGALNALHGVTGRHVIKQRLMGLRLSPALLGTIVFLVALETVTDRLPKTPIIGMVAAGIVLTMQHYGLILADNGSNWYFSGTEDAAWPNTLLSDSRRSRRRSLRPSTSRR